MKRLYKSRKNKVIDGVCGGIAEYFGVDPVLIRIVFVLFFFFGGAAVLAYIIGMIIMPRAPLESEQVLEAEKESSQAKSTQQEIVKSDSEKPVHSAASSGALVTGIILILLGGFFLMDNLNFPLFHRLNWWFWHHFWEFIIPGAIILLGLLLIFKSRD